jgi:hypothetical protein
MRSACSWGVVRCDMKNMIADGDALVADRNSRESCFHQNLCFCEGKLSSLLGRRPL